MKSPREIVLLISVILCADVTNGELGAACDTFSNCTLGPDCIEGTCSCTEGTCSCTKMWYMGSSLKPTCRSWQYEKLCINDGECWENAKCISLVCECNEGFYRINYSCRKVKLQSLMEVCKMNLHGPDDTALCDINKHSVCVANKCVCAKGYLPNKYGECELKKSYLLRMQMTEYRVPPGEYCREDTDCIEGLKCKRLECTCPRHKEKMKRLSYSTAINNEEMSAPYPLSPVQSSDQTVAATASFASRTAGTPIREDRGTSTPYPIYPPTAPNYPVNLELDNPPLYEEVMSTPQHKPKPSSLQNDPDPPPYISLSSGTRQSSSPSHSPSSTPYPNSPTAPPYPISPQIPYREETARQNLFTKWAERQESMVC
ncbi:uncharacterized protein [Penaeus vannamei]|uniref:uncharacterized protein isoform X3 n=1 Tax=Penaeus vannamei TaxID=6689 RepID=UPI00387F7422